MDLDKVKFYTVEEIAELLKLNYRTVLKAVEKGELKAVRFGKSYRITEDDLKEFIKYEK